MILSLHTTAGAVLASNCGNIWQVILLGIVSHYFLDSLPHVEYKIKNIQTGNLKKAAKEFVKIFIDLSIGLIIILYLIKNKSFDRSVLILIGSFFALIPDGLLFLDCCVKNKDKNIITKFLKIHSNFHEKTHSKNTSFKAQMISQTAVILTLLFLFFNKF